MNTALLALTLLQAVGGHREHVQTRSLDFEYSWPAAANRIPALRTRLQRERNATHTRATADAAEDARLRRRERQEAMGHSYSKSWQVAGDNAALLSLIATEATFTGGAHGNQRLSAMLWDRGRNRAVAAREVIGRPVLTGMSRRYCARLDAMRAERNGQPITRDQSDPFRACPAIGSQVLAPADSDRDGRFDTLCILFSPYEVGSYAEGPYAVEIPFRAADVAAIGAAWRARFEAGPATPHTACRTDG
jgi:hypothetical protein